MRTQSLIRMSIVGLVITATAAPVAAQTQTDFQQIERDARLLSLEDRPPFAGLSEIGALNRVWSVNTFYVLYRGDYPAQTFFWAIRRDTGGREGQAGTVWADSRSCPAVEAVLIAMERLPAVRPDAPRLGVEAQDSSILMDGTAHRFWNRWARSAPTTSLSAWKFQAM